MAGALSHTELSTGEDTFCTFVTWKSENDLANARPSMIEVLDTTRELLEEIFADLGVADPVSGPIVFQESS